MNAKDLELKIFTPDSAGLGMFAERLLLPHREVSMLLGDRQSIDVPQSELKYDLSNQHETGTLLIGGELQL